MKLNQKRGPKKRFGLQRPQASEIKAAFSSKSFKVGGYSVAAAVVVIAIAVAVNMIAGALPAGVTQLDMTTSGVYSLSQETENLLSGLEEEVTVYWVVQDGQEDVTLEHLLDRYEAGSSKIKVVKRDPDVYPTFLAQYDVSETYNNSLIVESGETFRYVSYNDMYEYDYSSYSYDYSYSTSFAGENALTSAVDYVVSSDLPKMYALTGHGETELSTTFAGAVQSANIEYEELSLLTEEAVPEDADAIMICSPQSDISAEEKELLTDYLAAGGDLLLLTDPLLEGELTRLQELMSSYGVSAEEGIVIEGDSGYYLTGAPYYLLPELSSASEITQPLYDAGYYVLLSVAQGLTISDSLPENVTVTELLTTTDAAYSKIAGYDLATYEKEEGDIDGPFALAVAVTDTIDEEEGLESHIVWVSSSALTDDTNNQRVSGGNQDFFINALNWMFEQEEGLSIHAKSLDYEYLTISSGTASTLIALIIVVIPLAFILAGIIIWRRRRHG